MHTKEEIFKLWQLYGTTHYPHFPIVPVSSYGIWVTDSDGNSYIDAMACYGAVNSGHCNQNLREAHFTQTGRLTATSGSFLNEPLVLAIKKLCEITGQERGFLMNTGAEAVESAIKIARKWGYKQKKVIVNKAKIIFCSGAFHGRTVVASSLLGNHANGLLFGPYAPGFVQIPFGDIGALEKQLRDSSDIVAFIVEPIQGEGGIIIPPRGYLKECENICKQHNVLLIADEIQTGLGRTGSVLACNHEKVVPDILLLGKALGGGIAPVSAILGRGDVMSILEPGDHGSTHGGIAPSAELALESISSMEKKNLPNRAKILGRLLIYELEKIDSPLIKDIRGVGLFVGIELTEGTDAFDICLRLLQHGVLTKDAHGVIRITPPLIITAAEIEELARRIKKCLESYK
jgi:ornithine--oxo-acid transaminase